MKKTKKTLQKKKITARAKRSSTLRASTVGASTNGMRGMPTSSSTLAPLFEGAQRLIPGEKPREELLSPDAADHQKTVMTIRTRRRNIRMYKFAARIQGETFPMNWAKLVLDREAEKVIRESGGLFAEKGRS